MSPREDRYGHILVACLAVVPGPSGTVTFIRQRKGPFAGNWLLPGGGVEVGEPTVEAVVRETWEETGCKIHDPELFAIYEIIGTWPDGGRFHLNMSCYLEQGCHTVDEDFVGHNVDGLCQAAPHEIPMHSTDYRILADAGLLSEPEGEIVRRLDADGLAMHTLARRPPGTGV